MQPSGMVGILFSTKLVQSLISSIHYEIEITQKEKSCPAVMESMTEEEEA